MTTKPQVPGRPRLDVNDPSVQVTLKLPSKEFDELCARATSADVSVAEIIRRDLRRLKNV